VTLEQGLVAHLQSDAGVSALVETRIYPLVVPQDATLPALAYQRISGPRDHAHDGPTGLARARVQLTYVASTYAAAKELAEAARAALDGFSGTMGTVSVDSCSLDNEVDTWADRFNAPVVRHDYMLWYQE
jgi:hypothetical protein